MVGAASGSMHLVFMQGLHIAKSETTPADKPTCPGPSPNTIVSPPVGERLRSQVAEKGPRGIAQWPAYIRPIHLLHRCCTSNAEVGYLEKARGRAQTHT